MIGNYHLIVKFGGIVLPLSTSILRELTIIQDLNKLLPEFRFRFDARTINVKNGTTKCPNTSNRLNAFQEPTHLC